MREKRSATELQEIAHRLRLRTLDMIWHKQTGHPGGSFSLAEILACLYFEVLQIDPERPDWGDRDRFILSKGHAAPILYVTLAERGYFPLETLETYDELDSILQGHPDMHTPGVDMASGSLGQGLSPGVGLAWGARFKGKRFRTYVLLGDGEIQEGQVWEAAMAASRFKLENLTAIVDCNRIQLSDFIDKAMPLEPLGEKWRAFGWQVAECDGHDVQAILNTLEELQQVRGRPGVLLAHTVKGKGVSFMENQPAWHARAPNEKEYQQAHAELAGRR
ncbi:MAG TPA: transketolase [Candidatus Methylomirabilis sp.]|nr:transketolase [Candidatus Methylomirabilis sp.]HSC71967.1 transketolase [Candidatus Methylomirabilis sp.]